MRGPLRPTTSRLPTTSPQRLLRSAVCGRVLTRRYALPVDAALARLPQITPEIALTQAHFRLACGYASMATSLRPKRTSPRPAACTRGHDWRRQVPIPGAGQRRRPSLFL
jgi:hypothetical protein